MLWYFCFSLGVSFVQRLDASGGKYCAGSGDVWFDLDVWHCTLSNLLLGSIISVSCFFKCFSEIGNFGYRM